MGHVFALTMDEAKIWAFLFFSAASAIGSIFSVYFSAKAKANAGAAKAATVAIATTADKIHEKATEAVQQNEEIKDQTNGHYSEMMRLLDSVIEGLKQKPVPVVIPAETERKVRKEDMQRSKDVTNGS